MRFNGDFLIMKFKFFIVTLLVILVAFLSASSVCAADVTQADASDNIMNDFSVLVTSNSSDTFSNDVNSLSAGGDSFSDLQGLIDKTSKGGTLDLDKDYSFNKNTDNDEGVSITKDILRKLLVTKKVNLLRLVISGQHLQYELAHVQSFSMIPILCRQ